MTEAFVTIVHKGKRKEIIPFLQSLSPQERKALVPEIKKLAKEYLEFREVGGVFGPKGNERQRIILLYAAFVCCNRADFEKFPMSAAILAKDKLDEVIDWHCPDWFNDYVNRLARQEYVVHTINYGWMMELNARGFIIPSPELVAGLLPMFINERVDNKFRYAPENLLRYPATLAEHVWYLFELESNVHYISRWSGDGKLNEAHAWLTAFKHYVTAGTLDRMRMLREALQAGNRNFNKVLSGWFVELFSELEPSKEEMVLLQKELFSLLGAPHSKPVNTSLQCIKKIVSDKRFMAEGFLDYVPVLLASTTKSVVVSTLMIAEKLAVQHADKRALIVQAVMQSFIHSDDDLQSRAARIIAANKATLNGSLQEELASFAPSMLSSARKLLENVMTGNADAVAEQNTTPEVLPVTEDAILAPIPVVDTIDDLVFIASQAFDNNQSWHIDVLPASLVALMPEIQGAAVAKLEPALQRALKLIKAGGSSVQGQLDHMLAVFFIDVGLYLVQSRRNDAAVLDALFKVHRKTENDVVRFWQSIAYGASYLAAWRSYNNEIMFQPYKRLLLAALNRIRNGQQFPVLSTPTHEPAWIEPEALVKRLLLYQQEGQWPDDTDLQVALSRCWLLDVSAAIALAETQLQGEYKNLCLFLFGKHPEPQGVLQHPSAWMTASLAHNYKKPYAALEPFSYYLKPFTYYTGQFEWESVSEEYTRNQYNYKLNRTESVKAQHKIVKVYFDREVAPKEKQGLLKNMFSRFLTKTKEVIDPPPLLLIDELKAKSGHFGNEDNDIRRILLLCPNNPEPLLSTLLATALKYPTFSEESAKRVVVAAIQALHEIWHPADNMAHVFVATCMLCSDKTVAGIAAEIWLQQAPAGRINNEQLGTAIGLHTRIEFAPLKRLTDLLSQKLLRISAVHNRQLQVVMESMLQELPDEPIKNLKKLLEIYVELLDVNKAVMNSPVIIQKLTAWKNTSALQKISGQLLAAHH